MKNVCKILRPLEENIYLWWKLWRDGVFWDYQFGKTWRMKKKDFAYLNVYFQSAGDGAKSIIFKSLSY